MIAIDSFRHMYVFSNFSDIHKPGKLVKFVADLHSGKLHREFHYGPEADKPDSKEEPKQESKEETKQESKEEGVKVEVKEDSKPEAHAEAQQDAGEETTKPKSQPSENEIGDETEESPRDSTFIKLAPSEKRYTLLRNEL